MSTLNSRRYTAYLLVLIPLALSGCRGTEKLRFQSPTHRYQLEIYQPPLLQQSDLHVYFVDDTGTRKELYHAGHEIFLQFAYPYWSSDERLLGLVVCGTDSFRVAYDIEQQKIVPFQNIVVDVRKSLLNSYGPPVGLPSALDPLEQACLVQPWLTEFQRRYPHGRTNG